MRSECGRTSPLTVLRVLYRTAMLVVALLVALLLTLCPLGETRHARFRQGWSRWLLARLGVRIKSLAAVPADARLWVANHVSWLDILLLYSQNDLIFVAKADIRGWPLVGWLAERHGTLFIKRSSPSGLRQAQKRLAAHLASGKLAAFFPEGKTSDGTSLNPFHSGLLQAAVAANVPIAALTIYYLEAKQQISQAAPYVGDMSLLESFWRIAQCQGIDAHCRLSAVLPSQAHNRQALAAMAADAIGGDLTRLWGQTDDRHHEPV